ncbi:MAG: P-loop NTPase fold protein [Verrucomicrobia bacterium]|nr:P-loop NTPase fold protein [Verrucomicrobiota bacterium]
MSTTTHRALRHIPHSLEYPSDKPFANDAFGREKQADELTKFISSFTDHPFVLAINGVWGSGKTTFIDMWELKLKSQGFRTLRFNAWECDHSEDPFASLLSEFRMLVKAQGDGSKDTLAPLFARLKEKAVPILKKSAAGMIKHFTMGALDLSADTEAALGEFAEASANYAIDKAESDKKSIQAFQTELAEFVKNSETTGQPVVYFIDELDRCRPTYAISVLERVKHLLNVPGVVFVFAWDRNQLNQTIKHVYGRQTDSGGYLLRFVDLEFNLSITNHRFFCNSLMNRFGLFEHIEKTGSHNLANSIVETFPKIAELLKLSIREQEKSFTALSVFIRTNPIQDWRFIESLVVLIMLRIKRPKIYQSICRLPSNPSEAGNILRQLVAKDLPSALGSLYWQSKFGASFEGHLLCLLPEEARSSLPVTYAYLTNQTQNPLADRETQLLTAYRFSQAHVAGLLVHFINKMEFSERFLS